MHWQLLEDFRADSRTTVYRMAAGRRGSPVLRRISLELLSICCRLEARLSQPAAEAASAPSRQLGQQLLAQCLPKSTNVIAVPLVAAQSGPSAAAAQSKLSCFAMPVWVHQLQAKDHVLATPLVGPEDRLGKRRRGE